MQGYLVELVGQHNFAKKRIIIMSPYFQPFSKYFSIKFNNATIARFAPIL